VHWVDFAILVTFLLGMLALGFVLSKRAGKNTDEFILAGRRMPWWLAGTSLMATGLNASTMLQDARKVRQDGIGGLWFSWRAIIVSSIAAVFFQRLWRRAGFVTQMEFYKARYAGRGADVARTFDSVIYGVVVASIWAAIGLVGMKKVAAVLLGLPPEFLMLGVTIDTDAAIIAVLVVVTMVYSAASGVYGVVWTDLIEAVIALVATYTLLFLVLGDVGGPAGLRESLEGHADGGRLLSLVPTVGAVLAFYVLFAVVEQGGYNPHFQRTLALKDEREVLYTGLYALVLNSVVKHWPYYICGLAGLFLVSDAYLLEQFDAAVGPNGGVIADHEMVFPALVRQYLPVGLMGLMAAGFLSAFMSSFDTNIHNSTSIFTNDVYRAYLAPGRDERHYVRASRVYMVAVTILASAVGFLVNDILYMFMFAINVMQSVGLVKLMRFIWWRVNIWGELSAMACSLVLTTLMLTGHMDAWCRSLLTGWGVEINNDTLWALRTALLVATSTAVSVVVIVVTPAEPTEHLVAFYRRVRPFGWWGPIREAAATPDEPSDSLAWLTATALAMMGVVFGLVFAFMAVLLAWWVVLAASLPVALLSGGLFFLGVRRLYPEGWREDSTAVDPPAAAGASLS